MAEKHSCSWRTKADRQAEQIRAQQAELEAKQIELDLFAAKVSDLEHQLALTKKKIFGQTTERMPTPADELKTRDEPEKKRGGHTAYSAQLGQPFRSHPGTRSGAPGRHRSVATGPLRGAGSACRSKRTRG